MKVSIECGDGNSTLIIEALLGQSLTGQVPSWPRSPCPGTGLRVRPDRGPDGRRAAAEAGRWCRGSCRSCRGVSPMPLSPLRCLCVRVSSRSRIAAAGWLRMAKVSARVFLPVLPGGLSAGWLHPSSIFSMAAGEIVCEALGCERHSATTRCLRCFADLRWFILAGS